MNRNKLLTIIGLLLFCIVVFLPPLMHGYVYPNIGDDTAVYVAKFNEMKEGGLQISVQYLAYVLVGYPIIFVSDILDTSIMTVFLWFNYLALALVGITIYFVISRLVGRITGWVALALTVFCAQGLMYLFYYGQIFNIINIGIFLPLVLYFTVKYVMERRLHQLALMLLFAGLFSTFHTSGIYLPVIAGFVTMVYVVYGWIKRQRSEKTFIMVGFGIFGISAIAFVVFVLLPTMNVLKETAPDWEHIYLLTNIGKGLAVPLIPYLLDIVSPSVLILIALLFVYQKEFRKSMNKRVKISVVLLACTAIVLAVSAFAKLSLDPWRQAVDFSSILALLVAVMIGALVLRYKDRIVIIAIVLLVGFGFFHSLPTWFSYNSAMSKADLEAIEYASNFESFSASSTIAPWIYVQFGDLNHQNNGGEVVLMRNLPMTPRSTEDNIWYQFHGSTPSNSYELTKTFSDGKVIVEVYEVMAEYRR